MWIMIIVQTIGSVDMPGHGPRKLPSPRAYLEIVVLWTIYGMLGDTDWGRPAAVASIVTVLAAMTLGPFGSRTVNFFNEIASKFPTTGNT